MSRNIDVMHLVSIIMKDNLEQIIKQCKTGERKAQEQLYILYYKPLANAAMRYAFDSSQAKDLVHDAFISCFKNIHQFRGSSNQLLSWMKRILINKALGQFRKNNRIESTDFADYEQTEDKHVDLNDSIFYSDIISIINKMNEVDRVIINLSIVEEFSHKEISQILEISEVNSRKRLSRAKTNLKQLLSIYQVKKV